MPTCNSGSLGGGSGKSATKSTNVSKDMLKKAAKDYINHHLYGSEQYADIESVKLDSEIDKDGYADATVDYRVRVSIDLGYDSDTGKHEYETDYEYRRRQFRIKVK